MLESNPRQGVKYDTLIIAHITYLLYFNLSLYKKTNNLIDLGAKVLWYGETKPNRPWAFPT